MAVGGVGNLPAFVVAIIVGVSYGLLGSTVVAESSQPTDNAQQDRIGNLEEKIQALTYELSEIKKQQAQQNQRQSKQQTALDTIGEDLTKQKDSALLTQDSWVNKFTLGGYGDVHANFTDGSDSDKFDFHRLVLYLGYDFADWIKFHSETELEHAWTDVGYVLLEQAYVDFLFGDLVNLRVGRILTPIGIINQHHEPTLFNGVERPNFSKDIIPSTWSSDGLGIFGSFCPSVSYEAYVINSLDGSEFSSSGIRNGRMKGRPSLNEVGYAGRLDWRPAEEALANSDQSLRFGISGFHGGLDNKENGGSTSKGGEITLASADAEYSISRFDFRGVVAHTNVTRATNFGGGTASQMFGWYVEGAVHFWPDAWKVGKLKGSDAVAFVRYEEYDTQYKMPTGMVKDMSKDREETTLGLNFYVTSNFVIKADYQFLDDASGSKRNNQFNFGLGWTF